MPGFELVVKEEQDTIKEIFEKSNRVVCTHKFITSKIHSSVVLITDLFTKRFVTGNFSS